MKALAKKEPRTEHLPYFTPAVDIRDTEESVVVIAEIPGVPRDQIQVQIDKSLLTITASAAEDAGAYRTLVSERLPRRFKRTFRLNDAIDQENINAELNYGVLRLTLPKSERAKPKRIEIKTS
ncbi:Hsp20/alpha crystallin family protein [bacterium]|nr:Hsp20/alpha crystallin family protein [bacterium]